MNGLYCRRIVCCLALFIGLAHLLGTTARSQTQPPAAPQKPAKASVDSVWLDQAIELKHAGRTANFVADMDLSESQARNVAEFLVGQLSDPMGELLGATLQPVGETLRAQLDLPKGQGLLVASIRIEGPSALAGLLQNDVLLSIADKPLATAEDLPKHLKAAGETTVPLNLLRAGKRQVVQVRPVYRVTLGPAAAPRSEFFIGVTVEPVDDALRAQLALPAGQGVVITDVVAESPAEKAGVKKHDIIVEFSGKKIDTFETLASQVQANKDKPSTLNVIRAGKPLAIAVTGKERNVEAAAVEPGLRYLLSHELQNPRTQPYTTNLLLTAALQNQGTTGNENLQKRLDQMEKEIKRLRETLEKVSDALKVEKKPK